MKQEKVKLHRKSPADKVITIVQGILKVGGVPLTDEQRFRLKHEALALKGTMLYQFLVTKVADEMQKEIVENCKDQESINYYRAVLADRRILEQEIDAWANAKITIPKTKVDSMQNTTVQLRETLTSQTKV